MKRLVCLAGALLVIGLASLLAGRAGAGDEKTPTIKDVMDALHKGANSPLAQLKAELKSQSPDWAKIQKTTKEFVTHGAALPKNEPPRGDPADFKKLATTYYNTAKAIDEAAQKEDKQAAQAAFSKLTGLCKTCHAAHKEQ
jgi:cytochrome c556